MKPYEAAFAVGAEVRVVDDLALARFRREWKFHNPVRDEQMAYAGKAAKVKEVGFYHGGDPLYVLDGIPGVWHEECLTASE